MPWQNMEIKTSTREDGVKTEDDILKSIETTEAIPAPMTNIKSILNLLYPYIVPPNSGQV